jgi:cAMP-dependent protein kinase regulator
MNKAKVSHKEEAQRAVARGEWSKALESFQKHCAQEPSDLRSRQKVAEVLERLGRRLEAIHECRKVAAAYAEEGFLLQAISVNKIILRMDPSLKDVNDRLAQLYTEKCQEARQQTKPIQAFPQIPLFSELNEQELQSLVSRVHAKTFQKDEIICQEGEAGDSLMVISQGEVEIFKQISERNERRVRSLKEGDIFGEFGFFTDHKRHATVKAAAECEVLEISRDELNQIIKAHPRIRQVLHNLYRHRVLDLFLSISPLFVSLSTLEKDEAFKRFRPIEVPEETLIFHGGDPPDSLYLIKSGEVEIFIRNPKGKRVVLGILKSGDFFGEIGPLFNKPRMASAKTIRPSELLELTKVDLDSCLLQFPQIRSTLKDTTIKRLTRMNLEISSQRRAEKVRESMV